MANNDFYYELKYVDGEYTVVHKFPADIDLTRLADYLKDFLRGCSWLDGQVENLIDGGTV